MENTIIEIPNKTAEQYCLDMPSSVEFHKFLSSTAPNYDAFIDKAKGLLSNYFKEKGIQTGIYITRYDDLHISPQGSMQIMNADFSFTCTDEDVLKLREDMNDVFDIITPREIKVSIDWKNLPLQKYPVIGKF